MIIKKTLSEFKQPRRSADYQVQDTDELIYQSLFSTKDNTETLKDLPTEVKVRMQWRAHRPARDNVATLHVGQHVYETCYIYNPNASYAQSIDFVYAGYARKVINDESYLFQLDLEGTIYEYNFITYYKNVYEKRMPQDDNTWLVVSRDCLELTGLNHVIYRGYGGAYKDGTPLSSVEQAYFTILTDGTRTQISLKKQSELAEMNLYPPKKHATREHKSLFVGNEHPRTPVEDILNGLMTIPVTVNGRSHQYRSIDYRSIDELSNTIEVTFVPIGG